MEVFKYNAFPPGHDNRYESIDELSEFDLDKLRAKDVKKVWYWYAYGSYEGSGKMLMCKGQMWYTHDLNHCSCYGPIEEDDLTFNDGWKTLAALEKSHTKEAFEDIAPLVEMARKAGYK